MVPSSRVRFQSCSGLWSEERRGHTHSHHPEPEPLGIRPFCGSRLPVEHSRRHQDAGLLLSPSPFLELSCQLCTQTLQGRSCLPQGPCLGWVYVRHLLVYQQKTELYWTQWRLWLDGVSGKCCLCPLSSSESSWELWVVPHPLIALSFSTDRNADVMKLSPSEKMGMLQSAALRASP